MLPEKYSPMSTLPISTKSRSTTDPSKYPKAGPNTAMAKRMAEKRKQREPVRGGNSSFNADMAFAFPREAGMVLQYAEARKHLLTSGR